MGIQFFYILINLFSVLFPQVQTHMWAHTLLYTYIPFWGFWKGSIVVLLLVCFAWREAPIDSSELGSHFYLVGGGGGS